MLVLKKYYLLLVFLPFILKSQVSVSPYSMFGIGLIEDNGHGNNRMIGGTGIAMKSDRWLNISNPASYSTIDSLSFIFELGFYGKHSIYKKGKDEQDLYDGNIRYLSLGYKVNKFWSMAIGLVPYSSINYTINSSDMLIGELIMYPKTYTGSGSINQLYCGNSLNIFKGLSVGFNFSYLFGAITKTESVTSNTLFYGFDLESKENVNNFYIDYGLQYLINIGKWKYSLGLVYGNNKKLNTYKEYTLIYGNEATDLDTEKDVYYIPRKYGIGIAVENIKLFRAGFDIEKRDWSDVEFTNTLLETRNSIRYSFGSEIYPFTGKLSKRNKITFNIGGYYKQSYLLIDNVAINSKAITFGFGIPIGQGLNMLRISIEGGENGTLENGLIRERYRLMNMVFTFHDIWFVKRRFD